MSGGRFVLRDFSDGSVLAATLPVVLIREARLEDEAALLPIHLATWTAKVSPGPAPDPTAPFFDRGTAACDVLVAEDSGGILGYVRLHQPGPMPSHEHVLVVNGLAVDPVRQSAGVGRALMHAALQRAWARALQGDAQSARPERTRSPPVRGVRVRRGGRPETGVQAQRRVCR